MLLQPTATRYKRWPDHVIYHMSCIEQARTDRHIANAAIHPSNRCQALHVIRKAYLSMIALLAGFALASTSCLVGTLIRKPSATVLSISTSYHTVGATYKGPANQLLVQLCHCSTIHVRIFNVICVDDIIAPRPLLLLVSSHRFSTSTSKSPFHYLKSPVILTHNGPYLTDKMDCCWQDRFPRSEAQH